LTFDKNPFSPQNCKKGKGRKVDATLPKKRPAHPLESLKKAAKKTVKKPDS
jgi:hypothetical protein